MTLQERLRELVEELQEESRTVIASPESYKTGWSDGIWNASVRIQELLSELPTDTTP
jgi:hypothetical protein